MCEMTGEQFLNSIRYLDLEITALDTSRARMASRRLDILDKAEGAQFMGDNVQHAISSKTESLGIQLAELPTDKELQRRLAVYQRKINKRIKDLLKLKTRAHELICQMADPRHRALLTHRYLENLKWATVADLMGYTQNWVEIQMRGAALRAFERVWQNNHVKPGTI